MELSEGLKARRSIRRYKDEPVSRKVLDKVFDLAKWAPGAPAFRRWKYYVAIGKKRDKLVELISQNTVYLRDLLKQTDRDTRRKCAEFYPDLGGAPVLIIVTVPQIEDEWEKKNAVVGAAIAIQTLLLAAFSQGLGTCLITIAPWVEAQIREEIKAKDEEIVLGIALGYPAEKPPSPTRKKEPVKYV